MNHRRDLIVANLAALLVLLFALLLGWRQEAAFGLAVLVILDLMVILRGRGARTSGGSQEEDNHDDTP